jgi:citrate synthase
MDALRASLAHMQFSVPAPDALPADDGGLPPDAIALTGAAAVFVAAWARRSRGEVPLPPDPDRALAADYLRMVRGGGVSAAEEAAMDRYLATVIEHGMNASTFAARVVASTEADTVSAVVAGVGALKGRLHGGAPGPVLDMLDAVGSAGRAPAWLRAELDAGRRIMGMGHRVYRARDPRAAVLERALLSLDPTSGRVGLARAVEREAERLLAARKPARPLRANVEFYTAVLLEALGLPRSVFSATFAVARVAGWCAHVAEQRRSGRLIRPRAHYVGARPAA